MRLGDLSWLLPREAVEQWEPPESSTDPLASQNDPRCVLGFLFCLLGLLSETGRI